jgi:chromosome partitioning protein
MKTRDTISKELRDDAPKLGLRVATNVIRDLQAYRDAAQQGTVVSRFGRKGRDAACEMDALFNELLGDRLMQSPIHERNQVANG